MEHPVFTYDQYHEENCEAIHNGCASRTYEDWVDYRVIVRDFFDKEMAKREVEGKLKDLLF